MYPQMTQISPIEAHLCHLRNLWKKIQVIRERTAYGTRGMTRKA